MVPKTTSKTGQSGEDFAVHLLSSKGYKIIDRNFRSRFGEIDIIATKDDFLIFIEVKTRWSTKFGRPEEAVTPGKIWKITKTAEYYSLLHPELPKKLKIEVVALLIKDGNLTESRIILVD